MPSGHSKKKPEDINRNPLKEVSMSEEDRREFTLGVELFNAGKFWHAHEAWENVWKRHDEDERLFFQGLIQLSAAFHHVLIKKSFAGIVNNFDKAYAKLEVFQPSYLGVDVMQLLRSIEEGRGEAARRGEKGMEKFNPELIPKLQYRPHEAE